VPRLRCTASVALCLWRHRTHCKRQIRFFQQPRKKSGEGVEWPQEIPAEIPEGQV